MTIGSSFFWQKVTLWDSSQIQLNILTKQYCAALLLIALIFCCNTDTLLAAKLTKQTTAIKAAETNLNTTKNETTVATIANAATTSSEEVDEDDDEAEAEAEADDDDEDGDESEAVATTSGEKTAVQPVSDSTSLSVWGMVRGIWNWLRDDISESLFGDDSSTTAASEGRTFGKIRRLQMALIPIIFKFGILTAMVAFLVMLSMKTIFLLKVLIFMNAAIVLGKFLTLKADWVPHTTSYVAQQPWNYGSNGWNQHVSKSWTTPEQEVQHPSKEIHLHIHGAQAQPQVQAYSSYGTQTNQGWERRSDPYSAYEPIAVENEVEHDELSNSGPILHLPTKYPANHRSY
ncbi:uncharacterized protein LOC119679201 [Teleopsis dalmanni]|uniref:uncharacterized protein LOC119679201 n=1 Tax=Teleopsis dalmanni TaxID=139649 RepID=UPI0018CD35DB|nr:uncharacterized protein LOC119679201 [Teleopsis dalmanni]